MAIGTCSSPCPRRTSLGLGAAIFCRLSLDFILQLAAVRQPSAFNDASSCRSVCAGKSCDDWGPSEACNKAADAGITCVAASGNSGNKAAILMPACASKVVAVGAVYGQDVTSAGWTTDPTTTPKQTCTDRNAKPDTVTCFSNRLVSRLHAAALSVRHSGTSPMVLPRALVVHSQRSLCVVVPLVWQHSAVSL
jgi:hypothetical protein